MPKNKYRPSTHNKFVFEPGERVRLCLDSTWDVAVRAKYQGSYGTVVEDEMTTLGVDGLVQVALDLYDGPRSNNTFGFRRSNVGRVKPPVIQEEPELW